METYIKFSFWFAIIGIIARSIVIAGTTYPRQPSRVTLGGDLIALFLGIAMAVWAGLLIFNH